MSYVPVVPKDPITFQYLDNAMIYLSRACKTFCETSDIIHANLWDLAAANGILYGTKAEQAVFGKPKPYALCNTTTDPLGMSAVKLATYGTMTPVTYHEVTDPTVARYFGLLHAKRVELICLLADMYLYLTLPYPASATIVKQPGLGQTTADYPAETDYPTTGVALRDRNDLSAAVNTYAQNMEKTYYLYKDMVMPFLSYTKIPDYRYPITTADTCTVVPVSATATVNALTDVMLMNSAGTTGILHAQRMAFADYLVSAPIYIPGTW